jgi:hypothetical protein
MNGGDRLSIEVGEIYRGEQRSSYIASQRRKRWVRASKGVAPFLGTGVLLFRRVTFRFVDHAVCDIAVY